METLAADTQNPKHPLAEKSCRIGCIYYIPSLIIHSHLFQNYPSTFVDYDNYINPTLY